MFVLLYPENRISKYNGLHEKQKDYGQVVI